MSAHEDDVLERPPVLEIKKDPEIADTAGVSNTIVTYKGREGNRVYNYKGKVQFRSISHLLAKLEKQSS